MSSTRGFAITYPLVTTSDGTKFGKSMGNAVWLDPAQTSPYRFYQFWLNVTDDDVIGYLRTFTFLSVGDIADIEKQHQTDPGLREGHRTLAREVTRLVHGEEGVAAAERISDALFRNQLNMFQFE
mgnify:FL=1